MLFNRAFSCHFFLKAQTNPLEYKLQTCLCDCNSNIIVIINKILNESSCKFDLSKSL